MSRPSLVPIVGIAIGACAAAAAFLLAYVEPEQTLPAVTGGDSAGVLPRLGSSLHEQAAPGGGKDGGASRAARVPGQEPRRTLSPDSPVGGLLRVRVIDADSMTALGRATVVATADSPGASEAGLPLPGDVVASGLTDADGRLTLEWTAGDVPGRILARAAGHAVEESVFAAPLNAEILLSLRAGLSIAGRVRDVAGNPVPGLDLQCAHSALPRVHGASAFPPRPGLDTSSARTGEDGAFRLTGLAPGTYRILVEADGWLLDPSVREKPVRSPTGVAAVFAEAGEQDVEIHVAPFRRVAARLVRARTGLPVASSVIRAEISTGGRAFSTSVLSYAATASPPPDEEGGDAGGRLTNARGGLEDGRIEGDVLLPPGGPAPVKATADVRVEGYAPRTADVTLRLPSELAAGAPPDVIALEPDDPSASATLLVEGPRDLAGFERPEVRILTACRLTDGRMAYVRGRREPGAAGDRWRFDGLPAGDATVTVYDGVSHSLPVRVTLSATDAASVSVAFPPPTGAAFTLKDSEGERVFDADMLLVVPPDRASDAPNRAEATRLVLRQGRPLAVLLPLEPGEYRFAVWKRGTGYSGGGFHVEAGGVVRVHAVLKPRTKSAAPGTAGGAARSDK